MYRSFEVNGFRCFDHLKIDNLERVNLIAGMNNAGKTSLLEALFLHCGAYNPALTFSINAFRGIETTKVEFGLWAETPWDSFFHQFDASRSAELAGETDVTGHRSMRLSVLRTESDFAEAQQSTRRAVEQVAGVAPSPEVSRAASTTTAAAPAPSRGFLASSEVAKVLMLEYEEGGRTSKYFTTVDRNGLRTHPIPPAPPFQSFFNPARVRTPPGEEAGRFGKLEVQGKQDVVLRVLKVLEPRLNRLAMVVVADQPVLHGDIGIGRLVALPLMGEGMVRLASLVLSIGNAPDGVVLVDEIENGLHWSILTKVWAAIAEAARQFNTQVFATTHSHECIVAAHTAFTENGTYDFRLHRIDRRNGGTRVVTYDRETLTAAIETNLEVR
jgi:hypothetical protein